MYVHISWPLELILPGSGGSSQCSLENEEEEEHTKRQEPLTTVKGKQKKCHKDIKDKQQKYDDTKPVHVDWGDEDDNPRRTRHVDSG